MSWASPRVAVEEVCWWHAGNDLVLSIAFIVTACSVVLFLIPGHGAGA